MKLYLIILLVLGLGCTKRDNNSKRDSLNFALTSNISTLDPAISYDTVSAKVVYQIYESLYEYDYLKRPYQIKPLLAKDLPLIEDNGLKYTIKLKTNIQYHDSPAFKGKKVYVKAQDFINQIKRLAFKKTSSSGWWLFDKKIIGLNEFREKAKDDFSNFFDYNIEGLQAPNDHTLVIKLEKPYPQLIYALGMAFSTPVPREVIEHFNNDLSQIGIGTGPYKMVAWDKNSIFKLTKFENYHLSRYPSKGDRYAFEHNLVADAGKKLPFVKNVNFHIMKEANTRWLNFRKKKIDIIVLTKDHFLAALDSAGNLSKEFQDENIKLQVAPTLTYWWLSFNMNHRILGSNKLLRQALAHTINIDEYIKNFTNNIALKANSIYPPGVLGYSPASELPYNYDIEKAKALLAKAGYPGGKGLPEFQYDVRGASTVSRQMGEFVKKELAKIGVNLKVNLNSFPGFLNKAKTGQLEIWQGGWAMDYPDPENVIQLLISKNHPPGPNASAYSNAELDKLYNKLFYAEDRLEVLGITKKVEKIIAEDVPWVMQFYSRNYILHHGYLKNFRQSDLVNNNFKYLRLE